MTSPFEQAKAFITDKGASGGYNDDCKLKLCRTEAMGDSLFKQATEGDLPASEPQPSRFSFAARAKYDARAAIRGMSKTEAMEQYVSTVTKADARFKVVIPAEPVTNQSQQQHAPPQPQPQITAQSTTPIPTDILSTPLTLPCGLTLPGRIVKAAMTEGLADELSRATPEHVRLYGKWAEHHNGGHVLITGNVQLDRKYVERPGNVVIQGPQTEEAMNRLKAWALAAQKDGTICLIQLGHAGRQCSALVSTLSVAPSPIKVNMIGVPMSQPRALTVAEIKDLVQRFGEAALVCKLAGFSGVALHAAHGYLLSSFLTPRANIRTDEYGGSLENRARFLLDTVRQVRVKTGPSFCISVKLNSADFHKGGMTTDEAKQVAIWLEELGVDLLEISGGNYENPSMMFGPEGFTDMQSLSALGVTSTQIREGYFLVFAAAIKQSCKKMPVLVTGGFRSRQAMEKALRDGHADMIGVGRPLCGDPECVGKLLRKEIIELPRFEQTIDLPFYARLLRYVIVGNLLHAGAFQMWTYSSLLRMGAGKQPIVRGVDIVRCLIQMDGSEKKKARQLQGLDGVVGLALNAPNPIVTPARVLAVLVLLVVGRRLLSSQ